MHRITVMLDDDACDVLDALAGLEAYKFRATAARAVINERVVHLMKTDVEVQRAVRAARVARDARDGQRRFDWYTP